jgi:hypothetical protein
MSDSTAPSRHLTRPRLGFAAAASIGKRLLAVEAVYSLVERPVRLAEILRHDIGIIEIGERRSLMRGARVEHGLREFSEFLLGGLVKLRPGKGVVDDADGIAVAAFKPLRSQAMCMREVMRAKSARVAR